jgi:hypothetical protein
MFISMAILANLLLQIKNPVFHMSTSTSGYSHGMLPSFDDEMTKKYLKAWTKRFSESINKVRYLPLGMNFWDIKNWFGASIRRYFRDVDYHNKIQNKIDALNKYAFGRNSINMIAFNHGWTSFSRSRAISYDKGLYLRRLRDGSPLLE